jgi:hypothetical protein
MDLLSYQLGRDDAVSQRRLAEALAQSPQGSSGDNEALRRETWIKTAQCYAMRLMMKQIIKDRGLVTADAWNVFTRAYRTVLNDSPYQWPSDAEHNAASKLHGHLKD